MWRDGRRRGLKTTGARRVKDAGKSVILGLAAAASMFFQPLAVAATLAFNAHGRPVATMTADDLARKLPIVKMQVLSPENGQHITYEGYRFADLLTTVFGTDWSHYKIMQFGCADGYQPKMKTNMAARHQGLLAVRESGKATLAPLRRADGSHVDLGQFYLVWENIHDAGAASNEELSWPWQLITISLGNQ